MEKPTVLVYSTPAYGHICANLYLAGRLVKEGYRVIYYATEHFHELIEANGCIFRAYSIQQSDLDLTDGQKILKLYRLILQYTQNMLPELLKEAKMEKPGAVMYDSLALWGRAVSSLLNVPGVSFYSIAAVNPTVAKSFLAYTGGFAADFWRYIGELPEAMRIKGELRRSYGAGHLGVLSVLMNQGDYNLMGYSRRFQPGGKRFQKKYFFLGPMSAHRKAVEINDFVCPEKPVIFISLGTVFNQNRKLFQCFIKTFGNTETVVVMVCDNGRAGEEQEALEYPGNFIVRSFVNQREILQKASLFISAGGLNSIHEALYHGVPCLICPQQGEQLLNARQFEKLGFGRILRHPEELWEEAKKAMELKAQWDEELRRQMTTVHMKKALQLFQGLCSGEGR